MVGHVIERTEVNRPDLRWPFPERMAERLTGRRIEQLGRRAKYILADLDNGETLIIHLGMSGRMLISRVLLGRFHHGHPMPAKHDHVVFHMDNGARVTFNDARRFGAMDLAATNRIDDHRLIATLGPEPLSNAFDARYLAERLSGRRTPIKTALLDQGIVAGLGNIYACEALHRAGLDPRRAARRIAVVQIAKLMPAIREVLREAITSGGSSLRDHRQATGELGYFQHSFAVYGREGQSCLTLDCTGTVRRIVQSGRSTFFCPRCQR